MSQRYSARKMQRKYQGGEPYYSMVRLSAVVGGPLFVSRKYQESRGETACCFGEIIGFRFYKIEHLL